MSHDMSLQAQRSLFGAHSHLKDIVQSIYVLLRHVLKGSEVLYTNYDLRESRSGSRAQIAAVLSVCTMYDHPDRYEAQLD